jgi:MFS family permease
MRLPAALRALGHRDYRLFWSAQCVSLIGRWMQSVAQAWLVLELTGSPLALGVVNALQFTPIMVLSFPAGAVADRFAKRPLIVTTQAIMMISALVLAGLAWTGHVQYWHVLVLAVATGMANALDMPTRQAFVIELVGRDDLMNAIALNSAVVNGARMVGPAVGGILIAHYGVAIAFFLNGVTYAPVIVALLAMAARGAPRPARGSLRGEIADGLRYAAGEPRIRLCLGLLLVVSVFALNHNVVVPLLAREALGAEVRGFGFLMSALGLGALLGAAGLAQFGRGRPPLAQIVVAGTLTCTAVLALSAVTHFWMAAGLLFVAGVGQIVFLSSSNTTLQVTTPDELRGRVMALYSLAFAGVTPIGAFLVGSVAEVLGARAACAVGGGLGLLAMLTLMLAARGTRRPVPAAGGPALPS